MEGTFVNRPNIPLMYEALARILGEQYGAKITVTVRPKDPAPEKEGPTGVGEVKEKPPQAV